MFKIFLDTRYFLLSSLLVWFYALYMNKLFPVEHAIKLVFGCQAKCSNLEFKSQEISLIPVSEMSFPENIDERITLLNKLRFWEYNEYWIGN